MGMRTVIVESGNVDHHISSSRNGYTDGHVLAIR